MVFEKASITMANIYNSSKTSAKTTRVTMKVHDKNREKLNVSFSWLHKLRNRTEICFKSITLLLIIE